jgi:hypothetical protein
MTFMPSWWPFSQSFNLGRLALQCGQSTDQHRVEAVRDAVAQKRRVEVGAFLSDELRHRVVHLEHAVGAELAGRSDATDGAFDVELVLERLLEAAAVREAQLAFDVDDRNVRDRMDLELLEEAEAFVVEDGALELQLGRARLERGGVGRSERGCGEREQDDLVGAGRVDDGLRLLEDLFGAGVARHPVDDDDRLLAEERGEVDARGLPGRAVHVGELSRGDRLAKADRRHLDETRRGCGGCRGSRSCWRSLSEHEGDRPEPYRCACDHCELHRTGHGMHLHANVGL